MIGGKENIISNLEQVFKEIILLKELSDVTNYWINFRVWEDFSLELYNDYLWYNFINVNIISDNHAAIDIWDEDNKLCIQVTKNLSSEKIKHTIKMFEKHKLYEKYDKLMILLVTQDKNIPKFGRTKFTTNWKYNFSKENIIGIDNILKHVSNFNISRLESFLDLCIKYFPLSKINNWENYIAYNLEKNIWFSSDESNEDLNLIKEIIVTNKDYEKWTELIDNYILNFKKDLDIAYNLKGVIFFNSKEDYSEAIKYFNISLTYNKKYYKAIINKIKSLYNIFIHSDKNEEDFTILYSLIKKNLELIEDKEFFIDILNIYWSIILITGKKTLYDLWINEINKLDEYSEFMYEALHLIYIELSNEEYSKEILIKWLKKYPKSLKLNLSKIYIDLHELDKSAIRYNIDILPKLNEKQYKKLLNITNKYYSFVEEIDNSLESKKVINQRKYQIFLLSFQLWLNNEVKYQELYNNINLNYIDKYDRWKYDLLRINNSLQERKFETAHNILNESTVKEKIPFVEYVKLASIFLYHWGYKYWNEILLNLRDFNDFNKNNIEYWEYLIQSEVLLWKDENVLNYINEAKILFKWTQHYNTILKIDLSTKYRDLDSQDNIDNFSKSLMELHKEVWDSDIVRVIKIDESKDLLKQLEKQLPKWFSKTNKFNIVEYYLSHPIPHYCLQKPWESYIQLLSNRQPHLPIRIWFNKSEVNNELIEKEYSSWKFILSYDSLFNLYELKLLEYYKLKELLKNKTNIFELYITRELLNLIRNELLTKKTQILENIYNFTLDSKIKVTENKWKIKDIVKWWKLKENENTYRIFPKWLINSISYAKKTWSVFLTDDNSTLLLHKEYWIDILTSLAINWKKLKNPLFNSSNRSESIFRISQYNYTFISFNAEDLLYIYDKSINSDKYVTIYQKYKINSSFFYLCNQININYSCSLYSFFNVFVIFTNKVNDSDKWRLRLYIIFFIYLFTEFFKKYISNLMKLKEDKEKFDKLYKDLEKFIDYNSFVIINLMKKLNEIELNNLLNDYEFLSEKDSEYEKWFWKYIPESIEKLLSNFKK